MWSSSNQSPHKEWKLRCTQMWLIVHAFQAANLTVIGFINGTSIFWWKSTARVEGSSPVRVFLPYTVDVYQLLFLDRTPTFGWCVAKWGLTEQTTSLKEIGPPLQILLTAPHSIVNKTKRSWQTCTSNVGSREAWFSIRIFSDASL